MISLRDRIIAFFSANQDEELTASDVRIKFDVSETTAYECLWRMCLDGLLMKRQSGQSSVYAAGEKLHPLARGR